jgi:glycosyltransferase involved in cell wall biosynthesis
MRILVISAPYQPTPPEGKGYGGVELVCSWYVEELVRRGHDVTTAAVSRSSISGNALLWDPKNLALHAHLREEPFYRFLLPCLDDNWDIVHDHTHYKLPSIWCANIRQPYVNTCHLPNPPFTGNAVALSQAHKETVSPTAKVIHLGVAMGDYRFLDTKEDYLLYLGYMAPHKRPHLLLKAAHELGKQVILAGPKDDFLDYFDQEIAPLLDSERIYLGAVRGVTKTDLLCQARTLALPIDWPEPGSTVCFEALASGTPVVGWANGALLDIITTPEIGRLVTNYEDFVSALADPPDDYKACRRHVKEHFSIESRIDQYEDLYRRVIDGETW